MHVRQLNHPMLDERRANHHCHAVGCKAKVPPEMLMCLYHWTMVPKKLQRAVWKTYRRGQCDDMRPSRAWFVAAEAAIEHVRQKEASISS